MYLTDFIFDGVKLSSLGYLVGSAVSSNNNSASAGSKLELSTIYNRGNHMNHIVDATYSEMVTATFDIIKYSCPDIDNMVEDKEISYIMRWLNRTKYCKFKPIYNDLGLPEVFFYGTFTDIQTIQMSGNVVGFTVTFTANTPYGFADCEDIQLNYSVLHDTQDSVSKVYYDESDEYGIHYPDEVVIRMLEGGNFHLTNELSDKTTIINNCIHGEIFVLDCVHRIITSTKASQHTTLFKDFNYVFPSFCNTTETRENVITSNLSIESTYVYKPIRKVGIIV